MGGTGSRCHMDTFVGPAPPGYANLFITFSSQYGDPSVLYFKPKNNPAILQGVSNNASFPTYLPAFNANNPNNIRKLGNNSMAPLGVVVKNPYVGGLYAYGFDFSEYDVWVQTTAWGSYIIDPVNIVCTGNFALVPALYVMKPETRPYGYYKINFNFYIGVGNLGVLDCTSYDGNTIIRELAVNTEPWDNRKVRLLSAVGNSLSLIGLTPNGSPPMYTCDPSVPIKQSFGQTNNNTQLITIVVIILALIGLMYYNKKNNGFGKRRR